MYVAPNSKSLGDFWQLIWEQNVSVIVMLIKLVEKGKVRNRKYVLLCYQIKNLMFSLHASRFSLTVGPHHCYTYLIVEEMRAILAK